MTEKKKRVRKPKQEPLVNKSIFVDGTFEVDPEVIKAVIKSKASNFYDSLPAKVGQILESAVYQMMGVQNTYGRFEIVNGGMLYELMKVKLKEIATEMANEYAEKATAKIRADPSTYTSFEKAVEANYRWNLDGQLRGLIADVAKKDGEELATKILEEIKQSAKFGSINMIELENPNTAPDGTLGDKMLAMAYAKATQDTELLQELGIPVENV